MTAEVEPARPTAARPLQRLPGRRGGLEGLAHALEGLQAGLGEGVGLEDDVEARDVVGIGRVGRLDADVSGFGTDPQRLVGEPPEQAPSAGPPSGLPTGWVSERTSATWSMASSRRLISAIAARPAGDRKSSAGLSTRAVAGLSSPTAK